MGSADTTQLVVWGVIALLLLGAEMVSFAFVSVYFAVGAVVAGALAFATDNVIWQGLAFAVVSLVSMFATRHLVMGRLSPTPTASNANTVVGKRGVVTIEIDNDASTGQVRIGTEYWTARQSIGGTVVEGDCIPVNEKVQVVAVQGVTARVSRLVDLPVASASAANTPPE